MNELLKAIHWKQYWLSFIFLGVSLILLCASLWLYLHERNKLTQSEIAAAQQKSMNDAAEQSVQQLKNYYSEYQILKNQGLVGDPPRLDWAEVLLKKYQDYQIPGFYFALSPTALSKPEDSSFTSDVIEIKKTPMQITFSLLHEGDFYRYMQALHQQAKGQFSVQECVINRDSSVNVEEFVPGFKGQCDILWISLKDITAAWPEGVSL